jgi:LPS sulfotransferase NodH
LIDQLVAEDANFRRLFIALGIRPLLVEFEQFVENPKGTVERIAEALGVSVEQAPLEKAVAMTGPYREWSSEDARREQTLKDAIRRLAFCR